MILRERLQQYASVFYPLCAPSLTRLLFFVLIFLSALNPVQADDKLSAAASSLAGFNTGADWEKTAEWQDYSKFLDGKWRALQKLRLNAMRAWAASAGIGGSKTVFYPFSGPDFLYEDTLFPSSETVYMAGLEPIGTVPDLGSMKAPGQLADFLGTIKKALFTIMGGSFFITTDMKTDFSSGPLNGVTPILLIFLERQGYKVDSVEFMNLDENGSLTPATGTPNAVKISYSGRTLVYATYDLSNSGGAGFINLMKKKSPGVTYLKAASYLLYDEGFSRIRNVIQDNSSAIVEDDSGIPLRYFDDKTWAVHPYGNYAGPISIFQNYYQADMDALFKKLHPAALTFGSGYRYQPSLCSLIVATKIPAK